MKVSCGKIGVLSLWTLLLAIRWACAVPLAVLLSGTELRSGSLSFPVALMAFLNQMAPVFLTGCIVGCMVGMANDLRREGGRYGSVLQWLCASVLVGTFCLGVYMLAPFTLMAVLGWDQTNVFIKGVPGYFSLRAFAVLAAAAIALSRNRYAGGYCLPAQPRLRGSGA